MKLTLEEINECIEENKKPQQRDEPKRLLEYEVPAFIIPLKDNGEPSKPTREALSKVLAFISYMKLRRFKDCATILPISSTSNKNLQIWGDHRSVSRGIEFMINIGLLKLESKICSYKYGKCNLYVYYKENEAKIEEFCEKWGIFKLAFNKDRVGINGCMYAMADNFFEIIKKSKIDNSKVIFSSNVFIKKPDEVTCEDFEKYLSNVLHDNYPQLSKYQQIADEINRTKFYQDNPDIQIKFLPHFEWDETSHSKIISIGIRATNTLCGISKEERKRLLDDRFNFDYEKDVKSSVPRLTLSLNKGEWVSEDVDIYELINKKIDDGRPFTKERREAIKGLHMRTYFDKSIKKYIHNCWRATKGLVDKDEIEQPLTSLHAAVTAAEGGTLYNNEIFFVESCVYLDVLKKLTDDCYNVWLLYDAVYFQTLPAETNLDYLYDKYIEDLISESFSNFIKDFKSHVKLQAAD